MSRVGVTATLSLVLILIGSSLLVWYYEVQSTGLVQSLHHTIQHITTELAISTQTNSTVPNTLPADTVYIPKIYMYDLNLSLTPDVSNWWTQFYNTESITAGYNRHIASNNLYLYFTSQFTVEQIIHYKLLHSPYLTADPSQADLFYVPLFMGSVYRWSRTLKADKTGTVCKSSTCDDDAFNGVMVPAMQALAASPYYQRTNGTDHFTVDGRISYEILRYLQPVGTKTRIPIYPADHSMRMLLHDLHVYTIEAQSVDPPNWHTIPYPSHMHYVSNQALTVDLSQKSLLAYGTWNNRKPFRQLLTSLCQSQPADICYYYVSGRSYDNVLSTNMYLKSQFCIQPHGDSQTRSSWYDCLQAVSIPVCFDRNVPLPFTEHIDWYNDVVVYIPQLEIEQNRTDLFATLRNITSADIQRRQQNILKYRQMLQYSLGSTQQHDAFHYMVHQMCTLTGKCI